MSAAAATKKNGNTKVGRKPDAREGKYQIRHNDEDRKVWDAEAHRLGLKDTSDWLRMAAAKFVGATVKLGLNGELIITYAKGKA